MRNVSIPSRPSVPALIGLIVAVTACSATDANFRQPDPLEVPPTEDAAAAAPSAQDASPHILLEGGSPDAGAADASFGKPSAQNLIPNGDFELGNTLFGSDYAYATANTTEGQYTVGTDGHAFNGFLMSVGDHTSGSGKMFIGNGKSTPDRVWFTNAIPVASGTRYYFEAWVINLCCQNHSAPVGPAELSFYANGQLLGTRTSAKLGVWEGLSTAWDSGSSATVELKLVNANTVAMGNDFAVDDIYLGTISTVNPS